MTLKQTGLHPTRRNDVRAMLGALELVAGSRLQLGEIVRAEVRQRMTFEPSPQIFDRIQVGSVGWQERYLNMPICTVQVTFKPSQKTDMKSCPSPLPRRQPALERVLAFTRTLAQQ